MIAPHRGRRGALALLGAVVAGWAWPASAAIGDLDLVSQGAAGAADADSGAAAISADGRFVAFDSQADNLVADDDDTFTNVFVRDLATGTTVLVSRRSAGEGGAAATGGNSTDPAISADGRYVAFESTADNLSTADDDGSTNVYLRDLQAQTTTLVSRRSAAEGGAGGDDTSGNAAISADGSHVAFQSDAENLSGEDVDPGRDVFVRDVLAQTTTLASRRSAADGGAGGDGNSFDPAISADGRLVAFGSTADNLSDDARASTTDVFLRDLGSATTTLVSRESGPAGAGGDASSRTPAISADGSTVAFDSSADNLSGEDDDGVDDVFVRDVRAQTTDLVSRRSAPEGGAGGDGGSIRATVSGDGRYVGFESDADNLSAADDDTLRDVFVRDRVAATTTLASRAAGPGGAGADAASDEPAITSDGRFLAFRSDGDNLSALDDDDIRDVFRRDLLGAPPTPPSPGAAIGAAAPVCRPQAEPPTPAPGDPSDITLTTAQLLINQRIDQAAIRRANAVQRWIDAGVEGRDLCQGALGPGELAAGIVTDAAGPRIALAAPDPRPVAIAAATPADPGAITLTTGQLLINQRISQAAVRRLNGLKDRLDAGLTGGDLRDGTVTRTVLAAGLRVLAAPPPAVPPPPSVTVIAVAAGVSADAVTLTTAQVLINQRISQAAVRRANALIARIEGGLGASDVRDGTVTALDLAPEVLAPSP